MKKNKVVSVVLCGVIFLVGLLNLFPLFNDYQFAKKQGKMLARQIIYLQGQQLLLEETQNQLPLLMKQVNEWQNKLVSPVNVEKLVKQIKSLGKEYHLFFETIKVGVRDESTGYQQLPLLLTFDGSDLEAAKFIKQVATLPWIVVVGDFKLEAVQGYTFDARVKTDLMLDLWSY